MAKTHIFHSLNKWMPPTQGWVWEQMQLFENNHQTILANTLTDSFPTQIAIKSKPPRLQSILNSNFKQKAIKKQKADRNILFSHFGHLAWQDLNLGCHKRIARFYGFDLHRLPFQDPIWKERYLELFKKADLIITEGPFMKNELVNMGCEKQKIAVLPLGVWPNKDFIIRENRETLNVLIAGVYKEKKGIDTALLAIDAYQKNCNKKVKVHLVGAGINATENDKEFHKHLEQLLLKLKKNIPIIEYGFVSKDQLRQIALKCQVGLLPSQWAKDRDCEGGFPVTFLELMSTGLPIISTKHCDIPFAVNEENGLLANERDVDTLAKHLETINNSEVLKNKSIAARKTVVEKFSWSVLKPIYHQTILA